MASREKCMKESKEQRRGAEAERKKDRILLQCQVVMIKVRHVLLCELNAGMGNDTVQLRFPCYLYDQDVNWVRKGSVTQAARGTVTVIVNLTTLNQRPHRLHRVVTSTFHLIPCVSSSVETSTCGA